MLRKMPCQKMENEWPAYLSEVLGSLSVLFIQWKHKTPYKAKDF
jgi:hypothetical protein